jgi:hypothetical protein|tara:strand:- start:716 stop:1000 length:285 start_codon:yes stop_codon:yes gene_type:complete
MDHLENINQDTSYLINEGISYELVENCYIILNLNNGEYYELNNSSSFIWDLISKQSSIKEIIENTKEHFGLPDEKVPEILSTLNKFEHLKLIKE